MAGYSRRRRRYYRRRRNFRRNYKRYGGIVKRDIFHRSGVNDGIRVKIQSQAVLAVNIPDQSNFSPVISVVPIASSFFDAVSGQIYYPFSRYDDIIMSLNTRTLPLGTVVRGKFLRRYHYGSFHSYANLYDQFRIAAIKVKVTMTDVDDLYALGQSSIFLHHYVDKHHSTNCNYTYTVGTGLAITSSDRESNVSIQSSPSSKVYPLNGQIRNTLTFVSYPNSVHERTTYGDCDYMNVAFYTGTSVRDEPVQNDLAVFNPRHSFLLERSMPEGNTSVNLRFTMEAVIFFKGGKNNNETFQILPRDNYPGTEQKADEYSDVLIPPGFLCPPVEVDKEQNEL